MIKASFSSNILLQLLAIFVILECFHLATKNFVLDVFFMLFTAMTDSSILS